MGLKRKEGDGVVLVFTIFFHKNVEARFGVENTIRVSEEEDIERGGKVNLMRKMQKTVERSQ